MSFVSISAQTEQFGIPALPGWNRLKGDEFNGTDVDRFAWGMYGDAREDYKFDTYGSNGKTGSVHIYRDQMISVKNGTLTLRATRDAILTGLISPIMMLIIVCCGANPSKGSMPHCTQDGGLVRCPARMQRIMGVIIRCIRV